MGSRDEYQTAQKGIGTIAGIENRKWRGSRRLFDCGA